MTYIKDQLPNGLHEAYTELRGHACAGARDCQACRLLSLIDWLGWKLEDAWGMIWR